MHSFKITVKAREDLIGIARFTEARWGRDQRMSYLKKMGFNEMAPLLEKRFCRNVSAREITCL